MVADFDARLQNRWLNIPFRTGHWIVWEYLTVPTRTRSSGNGRPPLLTPGERDSDHVSLATGGPVIIFGVFLSRNAACGFRIVVVVVDTFRPNSWPVKCIVTSNEGGPTAFFYYSRNFITITVGCNHGDPFLDTDPTSSTVQNRSKKKKKWSWKSFRPRSKPFTGRHASNSRMTKI